MSKSSAAIALISAILCAVTWISTVHEIDREREDALSAEIAKNANLAQSQVGRLATSFQVFDKVLLTLRQEHLQHGKPDSINDWLSALQVNRDYVGIVSLIGADGDVIATTATGMNLNFADRDYFKTHKAEPKDVLLVGKAVKGRQTGKWVISLTRRLSRPDGSFGGVVFMALDPSFIWQGFERLQMSPDAAIALFGLDGVGRVRYRNGQVFLDEDFRGFPVLKELANRPDGHYISSVSPIDQQRRVINFATLPDYPLAVLVSSSLDDVMRALGNRERANYGSAGVVTLLIAALMMALLRMQSANERNVAILAKSAERLRAIIDLSPVPMAINDAPGNITFLNQAFIQTYGYRQQDIPTLEPWWAKAYPDPTYRQSVIDAWSAELERVKLTATPFTPIEVDLKSGDGTTKSVVATATMLPDTSGDEYLVVLYDITERKVIERALNVSLQHQEALMKEIHHRVKNNLQVITSLLRLEGSRLNGDVTKDSVAKSILSDMQGRIRSMALLHESLYRSGTLASVDLGAYLKQLATLLFRAQSASSGFVQLRTNVVPVTVGMDRATSLGLLTNELISNCLKHGFPDGRVGEIQLDLQLTDDGKRCCLRVSDTGVGLPENFEARRKTSLGLQLIDDLCRQVGGVLTIDRGRDSGVSFTIVFAPDGQVG